MKKSIIIASILIIALCACGQKLDTTPAMSTLTVIPSSTTSLIPTGTVTPQPKNTETPWPTLIYYLYPTITPDPDKALTPPAPTITAPPPRKPPIVLPEGLAIEEYQITEKDVDAIESPVFSRHLNKGGWHYWPKGGLIDGKLFQAKEVGINNHLGIRATLDNEEIFLMDCGLGTALPTVITAWTHEQHWIIQSVCHQEFDVFWDGVSLNASKGYQSSFAFQILGEHPFYLFRKNDQIWVSYNNKEALLGYDEVKLTYCCMSYHPPQHYENLITFYAVKNGQLYYVAMGLFDG